MINYNGDLLPASSHFLNHKNRGLQFGDALSDHLRYTGKTLLFWEAHYFRLMASMRQLRMEIPMSFTLEHLEAEIQKVLLANNRADSPAMIHVTIFRKSGTALLPDGLDVSFILETKPLPEVGFEVRQQRHVADLFRDYYIQADALARLVHTNRITQVLASIYAHENGLDTCLLLNHKKEVSQGLQGNIFLRKGSTIKTPPLDSGCQEGILRKVLLNQDWSEKPYELVEAVLSPFELQQADELFLTDIENGIQCISHYRKASYTNEAAIYIAGLLNGQG
jgi:branched-chain amino acid aminotransferase